MSTLTRRDIREHLLKLLYLRDFHEDTELDDQIDLYFQVFAAGMSEDNISYIRNRYACIVSKLGEIDHIIAEAMSGWTITRIGKMELNILRLAVFEIKFDEEVPDRVAINEAVDLTKFYGSEDSSYGFVNGILAKVVK